MISYYASLAATAFYVLLFLYNVRYKIALTTLMNKLDILFTIPLNTVRHDTPTVLVQLRVL